MFLMTENLPSPHKSLGIVNATSHLMLPSEAIDEFEAFDQLFPAVEEKLKQKASEKGAESLASVLPPMSPTSKSHLNFWS